MAADRDPPVILCLSGHDPSGGAGIQADIETIRQLGGHAASLISCLTVQNSQGLESLHAVDARLLQAQIDCLLDDMPIHAIKLGALGSVEVAGVATSLIHQCRQQQPELPVVVDPVLAAGNGTRMADADLLASYRKDLLPLATLSTPNLVEATALGLEMETTVPGWLLITGTDSSGDSPMIRHQLQGPDGRAHSYDSPRLPGSYHGSGCTLAAAAALQLARGASVPTAVEAALDYCQQSLDRARRLGKGQLYPQRQPPSQ